MGNYDETKWHSIVYSDKSKEYVRMSLAEVLSITSNSSKNAQLINLAPFYIRFYLESIYQSKIFWKWLEKEDYKNLKWMVAQILIPIITFLLGILLGKLQCS